MTEASWLASTEPDEMLAFLQGNASDRKLRLFCCACVRRVWYRLAHAEASRRAVELAEEFADGQETQQELATASWEADRVIQVASSSEAKNALRAAAWCVRGEMDALSIARSVAWGSAYASRDGTGAERSAQIQLLRDVFGNPFGSTRADRAWLTSQVVRLAQASYDDRAFDHLPELADALAAAGCTDAAILDHLRGPGPHVRGCWVLDLILGKT